jgi:hypothetical protein
MKTKKIIKCNSIEKEFLILDPPYTVFGEPYIEQSQSIIMKVGGLREMIKDLDDNDSFRIEWFAGNKATEYSFLKHKE